MDETSALIEAILREQEEEEEEAHRRRRNHTTIKNNNNNNNEWQTVSYTKRNRNRNNNRKPLADDNFAADPSSSDVFSSVQRHSEDRRLRLLKSQIAAAEAAAAEAAPSRSKRHSDNEEDGDAEPEAEVKKAKQKKPKKPKVTVAEAASGISADDLDAFLAEITVSVSIIDLLRLRFVECEREIKNESRLRRLRMNRSKILC